MHSIKIRAFLFMAKILSRLNLIVKSNVDRFYSKMGVKRSIGRRRLRIFKKFPLNRVVWSSIYVSSDDKIKLRKYNNNAFYGVANLRVLDIVANCDANKMQNIKFFDINDSQLYALKSMIEIVNSCNTPSDFIEKITNKNNEPINPLHSQILNYKKDNQGNMIYANLSKDTFGLKNIKYNINNKNIIDNYYFVEQEGFLSSKAKYQNLKSVLNKASIQYIYEPFNYRVFLKILEESKYKHPLVWVSNIFNPKFMFHHPPLFKLAIDLKYLLNKYGFDLLYDQRLSCFMRDLTEVRVNPHVGTYQKLLDIIGDKSALELVHSIKWQNQEMHDNLSNIRRVYYQDYLSDPKKQKDFDFVILHLLLSHGVAQQDFVDIINKTSKKRLVVVEHNVRSADFRQRNITDTRQSLKLLKGFRYVLVQGKKDDKRNIIYYM